MCIRDSLWPLRGGRRRGRGGRFRGKRGRRSLRFLSLIHISEPTRLLSISYAVFCLKKKKKKNVMIIYFYLFIYIVITMLFFFFFFNDTATTEIYTRSLVGSVRCV